MSQGVVSFEHLRDLIVLEEIKNCLPEKVATYLNESKVNKAADAAVIDDEYVLTHKNVVCHL
uniref:Uncharacterized protein n=1 Tax=Anguilla anguilla TaxID=7936 RepID=A0A0E9PBU7_ANGAN